MKPAQVRKIFDNEEGTGLVNTEDYRNGNGRLSLRPFKHSKRVDGSYEFKICESFYYTDGLTSDDWREKVCMFAKDNGLNIEVVGQGTVKKSWPQTSYWFVTFVIVEESPEPPVDYSELDNLSFGLGDNKPEPPQAKNARHRDIKTLISHLFRNHLSRSTVESITVWFNRSYGHLSTGVVSEDEIRRACFSLCNENKLRYAGNLMFEFVLPDPEPPIASRAVDNEGSDDMPMVNEPQNLAEYTLERLRETPLPTASIGQVGLPKRIDRRLWAWRYRPPAHSTYTLRLLHGLSAMNFKGEKVAYQDADGNTWNIEFAIEREDELVHIIMYVNHHIHAVETYTRKRDYLKLYESHRFENGSLVSQYPEFNLTKSGQIAAAYSLANQFRNQLLKTIKSQARFENGEKEKSESSVTPVAVAMVTQKITIGATVLIWNVNRKRFMQLPHKVAAIQGDWLGLKHPALNGVGLLWRKGADLELVESAPEVMYEVQKSTANLLDEVA